MSNGEVVELSFIPDGSEFKVEMEEEPLFNWLKPLIHENNSRNWMHEKSKINLHFISFHVIVMFS